MNLILTMAGRSQRFADEGCNTPKYLLPWGSRTILWTILSELTKGGAFAEVFLIANRRDESLMPHVRAIMQDHGINRTNLTLIADTRGQAETALRGLEALEASGGAARAPVVFHNIDTILLGRDAGQVAPALARAHGYIDVFRSDHQQYSYVRIDDCRRVTEIAEKIVVSKLATSGFYGFASADVFRRHYDADTDVYISAVYQKIIAGGGEVLASEMHEETDTIVLGTPAEYKRAALSSFQ